MLLTFLLICILLYLVFLSLIIAATERENRQNNENISKKEEITNKGKEIAPEEEIGSIIYGNVQTKDSALFQKEEGTSTELKYETKSSLDKNEVKSEKNQNIFEEDTESQELHTVIFEKESQATDNTGIEKLQDSHKAILKKEKSKEFDKVLEKESQTTDTTGIEKSKDFHKVILEKEPIKDFHKVLDEASQTTDNTGIEKSKDFHKVILEKEPIKDFHKVLEKASETKEIETNKFDTQDTSPKQYEEIVEVSTTGSEESEFIREVKTLKSGKSVNLISSETASKKVLFQEAKPIKELKSAQIQTPVETEAVRSESEESLFVVGAKRSVKSLNLNIQQTKSFKNTEASESQNTDLEYSTDHKAITYPEQDQQDIKTSRVRTIEFQETTSQEVETQLSHISFKTVSTITDSKSDISRATFLHTTDDTDLDTNYKIFKAPEKRLSIPENIGFHTTTLEPVQNTSIQSKKPEDKSDNQKIYNIVGEDTKLVAANDTEDIKSIDKESTSIKYSKVSKDIEDSSQSSSYKRIEEKKTSDTRVLETEVAHSSNTSKTKLYETNQETEPVEFSSEINQSHPTVPIDNIHAEESTEEESVIKSTKSENLLEEAAAIDLPSTKVGGSVDTEDFVIPGEMCQSAKRQSVTLHVRRSIQEDDFYPISVTEHYRSEHMKVSPRKRRTRIPNAPNVPPISLFSLIKDNIGKDLSKCPLPVNFSEPISMLQRLAENFEYSEILDYAATCEDPTKQIAYLASYTISTYSNVSVRVAKPFNPVLGETFEFDRTDDFGWRLMSEQISHHPPIFAQYCEGKDWRLWQNYALVSKFRGKYIEISSTGLSHVIFSNGRKYSWTKVRTIVQNVVLGKLWIDLDGSVEIIGYGSVDGIKCSVQFLPYSLFNSTNYKKIKGVVLDEANEVRWILQGYWDEKIEISPVKILNKTGKNQIDSEITDTILVWSKRKLPDEAAGYYNFSEFACQLNEPEIGVPPTDSRLRPDQRYMEDGNWDKANEEKARIEEKQRVRLHQTIHDDHGYQPLWFESAFDSEMQKTYFQFKEEYWIHKSTGNWPICPNLF